MSLGRCEKCGNYTITYNYHFDAYICTRESCQHLERNTPSPEKLNEALRNLIVEQDRYEVLSEEDMKRVLRERERGSATKIINAPAIT